MQHIVSIFNTKGGSGKTTLTLGLADTLAGLGKRVLVIDSDPEQHSSSKVANSPERPNEFPVLAVRLSASSPADYARQLVPLVEGYDTVLIDLPARSEAPEQLAALLLSDKVLVPVIPSALDIEALRDVALPKLAAAIRQRTSKPDVFVVKNRVNMQRALTRELAKGLKKVVSLAVVKAEVPDSPALQEMMAMSASLERTRSRKDARDKVRLSLVDVCRQTGLLK